ncbi:DUF7411 family protein [Methanohalophilus sp.]
MKARVMFSGGKDSALSAILLDPYFDVELVTCTFSLFDVGNIAREVADELGFNHSVVELERSVLDEALEMAVEDDFPKNAINYIHSHALEKIAAFGSVDMIADGIRRDDRVPRMDISRLRSIEDRYGVHCVSPLQGFGRAAVDLMVCEHLEIEEGLSDRISKADYETELRYLIRQEYDDEKVFSIFPEHVQSRVLRKIKEKATN